MIKNTLKVVFILLIGMAGGFISSQIIFPRLLDNFFSGFNSQYLAKLAYGPVYFNEKKRLRFKKTLPCRKQ